MPTIALEKLHPHPGNANHMTDDLMRKLKAHLRESGRYPPIIVRPHPEHQGAYQILDGHHRVLALRELGHTQINCDVWHVDEKQATMLLLTLNRLHGEDDPSRRGRLIRRLTDEFNIDELARRLPDSTERMRKLMALTEDAPPPARPPKADAMLHAVTFFLTGDQRRTLMHKLNAVDRDQSAALVQLLELDS